MAFPAALIGAAKLGSKFAIKPAMRFAGTQLPKIGKGAMKMLFGDMSRGQIVGRLAPDALFGGFAAVTTPGDLGDKAIAGSTQFLGGGLGGLATGRAIGKLGGGETAQMIGDFAGSFGGDYAGMAAGDAIQRGKDKLMGGEGLTAWERMGAEQQEQYAKELEQQILAKYGLIPGARDQYFQ